MPMSLMKALDRLLGTPILLFLWFIDHLRRLFPGRRKPVRRILLTKYFGMGSLLLAAPAVLDLRKRYPEAEISVLTFNSSKELACLMDIFDEVLLIRNGKLRFFIADVLRIVGQMWGRRFQLVVDLEFFSKFSSIMAYLSGAPDRVGFVLRRSLRASLINQPVYYNERRHIVDIYRAATRVAALDGPGNRRLKPDSFMENESPYTASLLSLQIPEETPLPAELKHRDFVALNINASELCEERRWARENFVALSRQLLARFDISLVFIGGPEDVDYVRGAMEDLSDEGARVIDLSGRQSITELARLLHECQLFITNDSGPLHIALAAGAKTVSFFGPETPELYGPPRGEGHLVLYRPIYCSPCLNVDNMKTAPCRGNNICLSQLKVAPVFELVAERLEKILNPSYSRGCRTAGFTGPAPVIPHQNPKG